MVSFTFLAAALLLAITPGPGIAYVVARTVASGKGEGLACCLGTGLGGLLHVIAAALGLSLIVAQSALAFGLLKYLGAAYLFYLGLKLLLSRDAINVSPLLVSVGPRRAFIEGVIVEVLNVKTALFFLAFLPQFLNPNEPWLLQLFVMGCVCVALNTAVDVIAVWLTHRLLRPSELRLARAQPLMRISGLTMMGLGIWLALTRRQPL